MRCNKHGIAAGPDGQCVICRREAAPDIASGSRRFVALGAVGLVLVVVSIAVARPLRALFSPRVAPTVSVAPPAPSIVAEAPAPKPLAKPEPAAAPWPPADRPTLSRSLAPSADVSAKSELAASAPAAAASASAAATTPRPRPSEAAVSSAIRATPIIMFSTTWCGVCTRARAFMNASGLRYSERDIDHDQNARDELKRRTGKTSIPTIVVDGQLLTPGFSEQKVLNAVASSVQRRLGVDGIELRRAQ